MNRLYCLCPAFRGVIRWVEQKPSSPHRFRVECDVCGKYIKWGTRKELQLAMFEGNMVSKVVPYRSIPELYEGM